MSFILLSLVAVSFLIAVSTAIVVLFRDFRSSTYRWLAAFLVFAGSWSLVVNLQSATLSSTYNTWIVRLTFVAAILMAYAMFNFVMSLRQQRLSGLTRILLGVATVGVIGLMLSSFVIPSVQIEGGRVIPDRESTYYVVIAYIMVLCVTALSLLASAFRRATQRTKKSQLKIIFWGLTAGIVLGVFTNIILPNVIGSITPARYAWVATVLWTAVLVYAVVKRGFLNIRLAVVRTAAYALSLLTLAGLYFALATVISSLLLSNTNLLVQPIGILLALLLAFVFQPIKQFFDKWTNRLFYKDNYSLDSFFNELTKALSRTTGLRRMLQGAARTIADTLKSDQAFFFVYSANGRHVIAGASGHRKLPVQDARLLDVLQSTVTITQLEMDDPVRRLMASHRLGLVMPIRKDDQVIGFLCLGEHRNSGYTRRDVRALDTISSELVIAIQNALSVREVKQLNAHLEQRISAATKELRTSNTQLQKLDEAKDEFISMASHQLRTPLTSIKGYISMLMEGDLGDLSTQQKHILSEAFVSSERMVRLIGDFLNVSRLQTGKFIIEKHPVDLAKIVAQEIDGLASNAATRGQKFVYAQPKNFPSLELDENKIRQVIMNFADNAIYYSRDNSKIRIGLSVVKNQVEFTVKDTGIGVPDAEKDQLFKKFFRATNARKQRPDGTGVGLFLAQKVVQDHGGQIIFESKEGKGSTFGFRLPVPKASSKALKS